MTTALWINTVLDFCQLLVINCSQDRGWVVFKCTSGVVQIICLLIEDIKLEWTREVFCCIEPPFVVWKLNVIILYYPLIKRWSLPVSYRIKQLRRWLNVDKGKYVYVNMCLLLSIALSCCIRACQCISSACWNAKNKIILKINILITSNSKTMYL